MLTQQANAPDIEQYLHARQKKQQQKNIESVIYNIWRRLQSGQCIGVDVKIVILHAQIKATIFKI